MAPENEGELSEIIRGIEALKRKFHGNKFRTAGKKLRAKNKITELKEQLGSAKFAQDRINYNKRHFKCYPGFETYEIFNIFLYFFEA